MRIILFSIILFFIIFANLIYAQNFGVLGETYPIQEPNLINVLKARVNNLETSGYLKKLKLALQNQAGLNSSKENKNGHFINPLTDICWSCFFPLTIGNTQIIKTQHPDTENPHHPFCHCGYHLGVAVGYWEPVALVDVTTHPYFMVNLGGIAVPNLNHKSSGSAAHYGGINNHGFYYFHYINFPALSWFPILTGGACKNDSGFSVGFLSKKRSLLVYGNPAKFISRTYSGFKKYS